VVMNGIPSPAAAGHRVPEELAAALEEPLSRPALGPHPRLRRGPGDGEEPGPQSPLSGEGHGPGGSSGHWGIVPSLGKQALENKIEAYCLLPVISHLFERSPEDVPSVISRSARGTFVDPRLGGGKMNEMTTEASSRF